MMKKNIMMIVTISSLNMFALQAASVAPVVPNRKNIPSESQLKENADQLDCSNQLIANNLFSIAEEKERLKEIASKVTGDYSELQKTINDAVARATSPGLIDNLKEVVAKDSKAVTDEELQAAKDRNGCFKLVFEKIEKEKAIVFTGYTLFLIKEFLKTAQLTDKQKKHAKYLAFANGKKTLFKNDTVVSLMKDLSLFAPELVRTLACKYSDIFNSVEINLLVVKQVKKEMIEEIQSDSKKEELAGEINAVKDNADDALQKLESIENEERYKNSLKKDTVKNQKEKNAQTLAEANVKIDSLRKEISKKQAKIEKSIKDERDQASSEIKTVFEAVLKQTEELTKRDNLKKHAQVIANNSKNVTEAEALKAEQQVATLNAILMVVIGQKKIVDTNSTLLFIQKELKKVNISEEVQKEELYKNLMKASAEEKDSIVSLTNQFNQLKQSLDESTKIQLISASNELNEKIGKEGLDQSLSNIAKSVESPKLTTQKVCLYAFAATLVTAALYKLKKVYDSKSSFKTVGFSEKVTKQKKAGFFQKVYSIIFS